MSSPLSGIPAERRKRAAATLGLFSVLFLAVGAVAATGTPSTVLYVSVTVALVIALLLALVGWGVLRSVRVDDTDHRIDAAIEDALAAQGSSLRDLTCGCGHDHDPNELHVTDDPCSRDGAIHECSQTCETCVFSRLRATEGAERVRPRPTPGARRPMPSRSS